MFFLTSSLHSAHYHCVNFRIVFYFSLKMTDVFSILPGMFDRVVESQQEIENLDQ